MPVGGEAKTAVLSYIALGKEGTFGTYASATTAVEAISCTFRTDIESEKLDQIGASRGFSHRVTKGKIVGGTLEQYLHPQESVLLIANALGGALVSNSISGGFAHSVSAGNFDTTTAINQLSFNVRKGESHVWRYTGGRCNQLKITGAVGEAVKVSYEFVFKDSTLLSDNIIAILSLSSVNPFTFVDGKFKYSNTESNAANSTNSEPIQSFELTINNNIVSDDDARSLGNITVDVLPPTRRDIQLTVKNRFDTSTTYDRMIQATQGAIELYFEGRAISGTAAPFYAMTIRLPKVYNATGDTEINGSDEILTTEIKYDVLVDNPSPTTTSRDIGITFQNSTASY